VNQLRTAARLARVADFVSCCCRQVRC
jgi:hypothetical protein